MRELTSAVKVGHHAAAVFVIQRPDADSFQPNTAADPDFAAASLEASRAGVELLAYRCKTASGIIELDAEIPVLHQ